MFKTKKNLDQAFCMSTGSQKGGSKIFQCGVSGPQVCGHSLGLESYNVGEGVQDVEPVGGVHKVVGKCLSPNAGWVRPILGDVYRHPIPLSVHNFLPFQSSSPRQVLDFFLQFRSCNHEIGQLISVSS